MNFYLDTWKSVKEELLKEFEKPVVREQTQEEVALEKSWLDKAADEFDEETRGEITTSAELGKIILPMIHKIIPNLIANEIIGVQPMSGPVGEIFTMRPVYDSKV